MRIVILFSGEGSTMQSILDNSDSYEVVGAITNIPDAGGIKRAQQAKIPVVVVDHKPYDVREEFEAHLISAINIYKPDMVVLAGFMRILTPTFTEYYEGRCLNIHPSLLPKYKGLNTHQRAIDAGDRYAGFTIHWVTAELDGGPELFQQKIRVMDDDTASSLKARVQAAEQIWYPKMLNLLARHAEH